MLEQESCELLFKANVLALKRGLDTSKIECPFTDVCIGVRCYLMEDTPKDEIVENYMKKYEGDIKRE